VEELRTQPFLALLLVLIGAVGCSPAVGGFGGQDLRVLTRTEILEAPGQNAFEVIEQLRPRWLQSRGSRSFGAVPQGILVYQNESRMGNASEALRAIPKESIARMEWLDAAQAGRLPGAGVGHVEAAIMIYTSDWES
jgi:hypothetical protein